MGGGRVDHIVRGAQPYLHARGVVVAHIVYMFKEPRGSYMVYPLLSLDVATPENRSSHSTLVIRLQESRHKVPTSASEAVLSRMQFTLHAAGRIPPGGSRLVKATHAYSMQTRHAPSRYCREARRVRGSIVL